MLLFLAANRIGNMNPTKTKAIPMKRSFVKDALSCHMA